jgi:hypothetical protein
VGSGVTKHWSLSNVLALLGLLVFIFSAVVSVPIEAASGLSTNGEVGY